jgi:hypothetical protein
VRTDQVLLEGERRRRGAARDIDLGEDVRQVP